jgi:hypothetical protein
MSDKTLLILITRIVGANEWSEVWNFPKTHFIAFIRQTGAELFELDEFKDMDLGLHLDADIWVINGMLYEGKNIEVLDAAFDKVDWPSRKANLRIHRGNDFVEARAYQERIQRMSFENTKHLFKGAKNYSIGTKISADNPIVRFAQSLQSDAYGESLLALLAANPLHIEFANIMHKLSYVLHPLDIDFQGLQQTDFQLDYWNDLAGEYKDGKGLEKLERSKSLIFGQNTTEEYTAYEVIAEAYERFGDGPWTEKWKELEERHFPKEEAPDNIKDILTLMENQGQSLDQVKNYFAENNNPVHEWVSDMNYTLSEIRDALFVRETPSELRKQSKTP